MNRSIGSIGSVLALLLASGCAGDPAVRVDCGGPWVAVNPLPVAQAKAAGAAGQTKRAKAERGREQR